MDFGGSFGAIFGPRLGPRFWALFLDRLLNYLQAGRKHGSKHGPDFGPAKVDIFGPRNLALQREVLKPACEAVGTRCGSSLERGGSSALQLPVRE